MNIVAILFLLLLIVSATYAYYGVDVNNTSTTAVIDTLTRDIGTVVLSNPTPNLHINLTGTNMQQGNVQSVLYATNTEADYESNSTSRSVATATVVGGAPEINYSCTFQFNISLSGTMANSLQTNDAKLLLSGIYEDVIDLSEVTSPITIVLDSLSGTHREASLYATVLFNNKTTNQDYLQGKSLTITMSNSNIHCEILDGEGFILAYKKFSGSEYVPADIQLFSSENYLKDFELGFTIDYINPNRFRSGQVDTVFNSLYEASPWPGITFRIQNSKWFFQVGNGLKSVKLTFEPNEVQSFKVMRINNVVYYSLNNDSPIMVMNMSGLTRTFDTPVTFGVAFDTSDNPKPERYLMAEVSNMYVRFLENSNTDSLYDYVDNMIEDFVGEDLNVVFNSSKPHLFDGTSSTAIDSGVALFSTENYQKSWVVTLYIESFDYDHQTFSQATVFNAKDESAKVAPGIVLRRSSSRRLDLALRNPTGSTSQVPIDINTKRINIIKKGMLFYYQVDYGNILSLGSGNDLSNYTTADCFDINATFGSNISSAGSIDRIIIGTLSNMRIKMSN